MVIIDGITIDVAESELHRFPNRTTDHPLARGVAVTDHVIFDPVTLTVRGVVSNTPFERVAALRPIGRKPSLVVEQALVDLRDSGRAVTVQTVTRVYLNMVVIDLNYEERGGDDDSLEFSITFKQLTFVDTERATVQVAIERAKSRSGKGVKPSPEVTPPEKTEARRRSILTKIVDVF